jgi:predicted nucleic acid-binding protein
LRLLLDSTILIDVLRGDDESLRLLDEAASAGHELTVSAMNLGEVYGGMRRGEEAFTHEFLQRMICFPVTSSIAERAGRIKNDAARKGKTVGLADMIIAVTALEYGLAVVTDNRKDFLIAGVSFYPSN